MQAHLEGTANRLVEHGHDLVRVSSHAGSCPLCLPYQGKILSLTGRDKDDPRCYATLREAKDNGLFHPNCRHAYSLFIDLDAEIEALEGELGEESISVREDRQGSAEEATTRRPPDKLASMSERVRPSESAKQGVERAVSEILANGLRTGTEWLETLGAETGQSVYNQVQGTVDEVVFPRELVELLTRAGRQSVLLVHNHIDSTVFSDGDFVRLL